MKELDRLRVAVAHYWLLSFRGGERVLEQILRIFPQADVYTLLCNKDTAAKHFSGRKVYSSPLDIAPARRLYKELFPLYPLLVKSLRLKGDYDLLITSESGPVKGLPNPKGVPHLCYIHSPMRYCHGFTGEYTQSLPSFLRGAAEREFARLRRWDLTTKDKPGWYIANSENVRRRVREYYGRDAEVIHPPVGDHFFEAPVIPVKERRPYYVYLGAITPYKNVPNMIAAFNDSGKDLLIIGTGGGKALRASARRNISFCESISEEEKTRTLSESSALIFPQEEDFGIVPLEAMALGVPVIAFGRGGATETVLSKAGAPECSTGLFFQRKDCSDLNKVVEEFEAVKHRFDPGFIRDHARRFGEDVFRKQFRASAERFLSMSQAMG